MSSSASPISGSAPQLVDLIDEAVDIVSADGLGRDEDLLAGRDARLIAAQHLGFLRIAFADEEHDPAAVGQGLFDQVASLFAGGVIVGAEIAGAVALRGVAVLGEDERLFGDIVDHLDLIGGIDRADGDAGDAFGEQGVNDAFLFGSGAFAGNFEFDFDVGQVLISLFAAAPSNRPEVGSVVSNKS